MLPRDQEWTALAECAQVDPDLWHPEKGGNNEFAKKICERCPVKRECLDYVIAYEAGDFGTKQSYPTGIYGGLSAMERRPLIKAHRQDVLAATGTEAAVPIATATTVDEQPTVRQYGLPYVGGANGDTHYPLPNPDRVVHIEPRAHAKPSIDWDEIRRKHEERRRAEGTLDDQPTTTVVQLRCRWCREPAEELTNDLCPSCVADAEAKFTAPDTTVLGQDLARLELADPDVAAAAASLDDAIDHVVHREDHIQAPRDEDPMSHYPDYIRQMADIMAITEGHPDPEVKAARKAVANAFVALNKKLQASPVTEGQRNAAVLEQELKAVEKRGRRAPATPRKPKVNNSHRLAERITALGVTAAQLRSWATEQGLDVPSRGAVPGRIVDAYEQAHTEQAVAS